MNIHLQANFGVKIYFISLGYTLRRGIAESYGNSVTFGRTTKLFPKCLPHIPLPPAVYEGSDFSTFLSTLVIICLVFLASLVAMNWCFFVALVCFSLVANDAGASFHVLALYVSSLGKKCLFRSFAHV